MRYLLIDEDGLLHDKTGTWAQIEKDLGDMGTDRMRLHEVTHLRGIVSDVGLVVPDRFRRNPVGGTVAIACGALVQPWAGPIVFCGWDDRDEFVDVQDWQLVSVAAVLRAVRSALGMPVVGDMDPMDAEQYRPSAVAAYRNVAAMITDAPHQGFRILSGDEALAHLERMGRDVR